MAPDLSSKLARRLIESSGFRTIRRKIMEAEARSEETFTKHQAKVASVNLMSLEDLRTRAKQAPSVDTFFILGSGASIENLTAANFDEIAQQVSVGINNWGVHSFIPDIYALESVPAAGDGRGFSRALGLLSRKEVVNRRPSILVLKPRTENEIMELKILPSELRQQVSFYGRIAPATRLEGNLRQEISDYFSHVATKHPSVVLDSGASIIRMINVGILLGFRKIVLLGVDLNGSPYFWEKNSTYFSNMSGPQPITNQPAGTHETALQLSRAFDVVTFVRSLSRFFSEELDGALFVGSSGSRLADFLPVTDWRNG